MPSKIRKLDNILTSASRKVFLSVGTNRRLKDHIMIEKTAALLEHELHLPKHRLEVPGLTFDRLLLTYSKEYNRTRKLALKLGAQFKAARVSRKSVYFDWDPGRLEIEYSPVEARLRKVVRPGPRANIGRQVKQYKELQNRITSIYHELNHYIIFTLLSPKLENCSKRDAVESYYALVESLVRLRDVQLADELGDAAEPIWTCGAINYALPRNDKPATSLYSRSGFMIALPYMFFQGLSYSNDEIDRLFLKRRFPLIQHDYLEKHSGYSVRVQKKWFRRYLREHQAEIRRPCVDRASSKYRPDLALLNGKQMPRQPAEVRRLYNWYASVFID